MNDCILFTFNYMNQYLQFISLIARKSVVFLTVFVVFRCKEACFIFSYFLLIEAATNACCDILQPKLLEQATSRYDDYCFSFFCSLIYDTKLYLQNPNLFYELCRTCWLGSLGTFWFTTIYIIIYRISIRNKTILSCLYLI